MMTGHIPTESLVLHHSREVTKFSNWNNGYVNKVHARVKVIPPRLHQSHSPLRLFHPLMTLAIPLMKLLLLDFLMKRLPTFEKNKISFFKDLKEGCNWQ